jgi:hypothetical protein
MERRRKSPYRQWESLVESEWGKEGDTDREESRECSTDMRESSTTSAKEKLSLGHSVICRVPVNFEHPYGGPGQKYREYSVAPL